MLDHEPVHARAARRSPRKNVRFACAIVVFVNRFGNIQVLHGMWRIFGNESTRAGSTDGARGYNFSRCNRDPLVDARGDRHELRAWSFNNQHYPRARRAAAGGLRLALVDPRESAVEVAMRRARPVVVLALATIGYELPDSADTAEARARIDVRCVHGDGSDDSS
jgi:hypothetical protein